MGELKNKGREGVKENQDKYQEIQEGAEQSLEERNRNIEIVHSLEGVDDDDKASYEDSKNLEDVIRDQIAESQFDSKQIGQHTIGAVGIETVTENKESQHRKLDKASIEKQFEISAAEFDRIANEGKDIEYDSSPEIDAIMSQMEMDW